MHNPFLDCQETITKQLSQAGFVVLGTSSLKCEEDFSRYEKWLSEGRQAGMAYLAKNTQCRRDPEFVLKGAKTVMAFGWSYNLSEKWPMPVGDNEPRVASYARFPDYHDWMKKKAEDVMRDLKADFKWRVAVDTVPVLERAFAHRTGAGFIGKNTCFIHPRYGSWLLLGEIFLSIGEEVHEAITEKEIGCGTCTLCQVECPTGALDTDYKIDARRCLSYWTIENKGPIPREYWPWLSKYWYGCDICQLVCPFNQGVPKTSQTPLEFPDLFQIAGMDQNQYELWFANTALNRAGRNGLRRNALIALWAANSPRLEEALALAEQDCPSPIKETLEGIRLETRQFGQSLRPVDSLATNTV